MQQAGGLNTTKKKKGASKKRSLGPKCLQLTKPLRRSKLFKNRLKNLSAEKQAAIQKVRATAARELEKLKHSTRLRHKKSFQAYNRLLKACPDVIFKALRAGEAKRGSHITLHAAGADPVTIVQSHGSGDVTQPAAHTQNVLERLRDALIAIIKAEGKSREKFLKDRVCG